MTGSSPSEVAEMLTREMIDDETKLQSRPWKNWATVSFGLNCKAVLSWLDKAKSWSPALEVQDDRHAKKFQSECRRHEQTKFDMVDVQEKWRRAASRVESLMAENADLQKQLKSARCDLGPLQVHCSLIRTILSD